MYPKVSDRIFSFKNTKTSIKKSKRIYWQNTFGATDPINNKSIKGDESNMKKFGFDHKFHLIFFIYYQFHIWKRNFKKIKN